MIRLIMALMLIAGAARAEGERAGAFDYYVLALSWTPTWCAIEGDGRGSPQCDPGQGFGFTLHGLWPQYEEGWPSYCPTSERNPSRGMTADMADIMGSSGLAWHQWNKHGVCSGLSARDYFALSRLAYERVTRPDLLRNLGREVRLPAEVIEGHAPGFGAKFKRAALGRRGITAWVEREGRLALGQMLRLHIPDQPVWSELARARGTLL